MFRPQDSVVVESPTNWATLNPIVLLGVFAVSSDGSGVKVGNGVDHWNDLVYLGANAIRDKLIQSSRDPTNRELLVFCDAQDKWVYSLQGCSDTITNWESNASVFPTYTLMIELDEFATIPTGRFKIGDGSTTANNLPWAGSSIDTSGWPVGYSWEFNGTSFEPASYLSPNTLQSATAPVGAFHRDDGTWSLISDVYVTGDTSSTANNIAVFNDTTGTSIIDSGVNVSDLPATTGCAGDTWQLHNGIGPKLKNVAGDLTVYKNDGVTLANATLATIIATYGTFPTILVGSPATEATSVTLTSDGTYLYVDAGRLIDTLHDGHGCSFDADTLDTYHAADFATLSPSYKYVKYWGELVNVPATYSIGDEFFDTATTVLKKFISYSVGWKVITIS